MRTDIKQRGVTLIEECFHADRIIKEKPGRQGRTERKTEQFNLKVNFLNSCNEHRGSRNIESVIATMPVLD